jgi:hypothetical protein
MTSKMNLILVRVVASDFQFHRQSLINQHVLEIGVDEQIFIAPWVIITRYVGDIQLVFHILQLLRWSVRNETCVVALANLP